MQMSMSSVQSASQLTDRQPFRTPEMSWIVLHVLANLTPAYM